MALGMSGLWFIDLQVLSFLFYSFECSCVSKCYVLEEGSLIFELFLSVLGQGVIGYSKVSRYQGLPISLIL